jgi:hypothetical protein
MTQSTVPVEPAAKPVERTETPVLAEFVTRVLTQLPRLHCLVDARIRIAAQLNAQQSKN